jgi:polysaccharide biosynthesis protein VpsQ
MKHITFFLSLFIIVIFILADINALPHFLKQLYDFPGGDKVGHFILFGLLNFTLTLTTLQSLRHSTPRLVAVSTGFLLALVILAEELTQLYIPARTFSLWDLLAGYLGVWLGGWMAYKKAASSPD